MREYRLISADGHISEPPNLWTDRLAKKFQDRAPRMERFEQGDAWVMEGSPNPINFGYNTCAGTPSEDIRPWVRWEDIHPRNYEPKARIAAQDEDGVDAEVLYPQPRPSATIFGNNTDPEFHLACIRAYNDWLSETCNVDPDRLIGAAMIPTLDAETAVEEMERAMKLPGIRTPYLGRWPSAGPYIDPEDDKFWAAAEEMGVPVSIHVSVSSGVGSPAPPDPDRRLPGARGELRHIATPGNCLELINSGVFDRFPKLHVVFAECDSSWIPYAKEQFDDRFLRHSSKIRPDIKRLPSAYFDENIFTTYVIDKYAIINRYHIKISQFMWSNDFAHIVTDWPNSWKTINDNYEGVPEDEKHAILAGNAARVYGLGNGK